MPPNVVQILETCPLFAQVPADSFQRLAIMATLRTFKAGEQIFREGDDCPGVYIVSNGLIRIYKTGPGGKEHVLHMVAPGQTFAEVAAIGDFAVPASAQAVADSQCVLLPSEPFRKMLDDDHLICRGMLTGLTRWVRHLVDLIEDVVLRDAAGRLARYLLDMPEERDENAIVRLPTLRRHLASHLNLTSETFSRTIRRLGEAGLIDPIDAGTIRLLDRDKLRMVADGLFPRI